MSRDKIIKITVRRVIEASILEEGDGVDLRLELMSLIDWITRVICNMLTDLEEDIILESYDMYEFDFSNDAELVVFMHLSSVIEYMDATFFSE